jgi:hypothetical protein
VEHPLAAAKIRRRATRQPARIPGVKRRRRPFQPVRCSGLRGEKVQLTWGQAVKHTGRDPQFIHRTVNFLSIQEQ